MNPIKLMIWGITVALLPLLGCTPQVIEPRAKIELRKMCDTLTQAKSISFSSQKTVDVMQDSGNIIHEISTMNATLNRPNQLSVHITKVRPQGQVWLDNGRLTMLNLRSQKYAYLDNVDTIDAMINVLENKYGLALPLSDLISSNPYESVMTNTYSGKYLGTVDLNENNCHHLSFNHRVVDWEIWIDTGEISVPRKIVIIYKTETGQPRFSATFEKWNIKANSDANIFKAKIPEGSGRVTLDLLIKGE